MTKPLVFIPGVPATELWYRHGGEELRIFPPHTEHLQDAAMKKRVFGLLAGPDDPPGSVVPGRPITSVTGLSKQAKSLYDLLEKDFGYDVSRDSGEFAAVGWDWRKGIDDPQTESAVTGAINRLFEATGKRVVVMPHSTGGLVFRSVLEKNPALAERIEQVVAFGVPWAGTLAALHSAAIGESAGFFFIKLIRGEESQRFLSRAQALYDLLPPDPHKTDMAGVNLFMRDGQQAGPCVVLDWIGADRPHMLPLARNADARFGARTREIAGLPPTTNVVGWGVATLSQCDLRADNTLRFSDSPTQLGDGTAPLVSASWLRGANVRTMYIPIGAFNSDNQPHHHGNIWDSPPVRQLLREVLGDQQRAPLIAASIDGDDVIDPTRDPFRVRISAADADGKPLRDCVVTLKPSNGTIPVLMREVLATVRVSRRNLHTNVGNDQYRFNAEVKWAGGQSGPIPLRVHTS
jgi:pimeloyl-ACP methyl ester carboxylesterase